MSNNTGTNNMDISVAICTYNGEKYIGEQLDSIVNQTVKVSEIIICDDCSIDGTVMILNDYQERYPNLIKVIINENNLGYVKNFEKAISVCTGELIFLSDQDDVWRPDKVEKISNKFYADNKVTCVFTDAKVIGETLGESKGKLWDQVGFTKEKRKEFINEGPLKQLIKRNVVTGATMAIRRSLIELFLPIPEYFTHDAWISFIGAVNGKVDMIDEPLILYRQHENQEIGAGKSILAKIKRAKEEKGFSFLRNYEASKKILEKVIECQIPNNLDKETVDLAFEKHNFNFMRLENKNRSIFFRIVFAFKIKNLKKYSTFTYGMQNIIKDIFF